MTVLPPGTILQLLYLKERLSRYTPARFIEVGPGSGEITYILLELGWTGTCFDIEPKIIFNLGVRFKKEIAEKRLITVSRSFISAEIFEQVDLVVSCMVMEHLDNDAESAYMAKSAACLSPDGIMMGLVPASPAHWGIEDEIAGHYRRYTRDSLTRLVVASNWRMLHLTGLTVPISNLLLPASNFLVRRSEKHKLKYSNAERTKLSGRRSVKYKTYFPHVLAALLNPIVLFPLHLLQKLFGRSQLALTLFFEAKPKRLET